MHGTCVRDAHVSQGKKHPSKTLKLDLALRNFTGAQPAFSLPIQLRVPTSEIRKWPEREKGWHLMAAADSALSGLGRDGRPALLSPPRLLERRVSKPCCLVEASAAGLHQRKLGTVLQEEREEEKI